MRRFRELVGVALAGLTARKIRTFLIMLGPILGVAAIVSAIGINESSKGDLKAKLRELGTDLIVANAQDQLGGFGANPRIPRRRRRGWRGSPTWCRCRQPCNSPTL